MSVESLAIALHHTEARTPVEKLVIVGIANHDGDGGAWPSIATLADYAGANRRTVQRAILELERIGEIRREIQAGGTSSTAPWDRPNLYRFTLSCPPNCDRRSSHRLLCAVCRKRIPLELGRRAVTCSKCVELPIPTFEDPAVPVSPRGVQTAPPAVSTPPEPSMNQPLNKESANSHLPGDNLCSFPPRARRSLGCEPSKDTGRCLHCGEVVA